MSETHRCPVCQKLTTHEVKVRDGVDGNWEVYQEEMRCLVCLLVDYEFVERTRIELEVKP